MTAQRARSLSESINGYRVIEFPGARPHSTIGFASVREDGTEVARAYGKDAKHAIKELIDKVYRLHGAIVRQRAGHRCELCGKLGPTEIDHIIPRSKGRNDRMENLRALCHSDHLVKHGARIAAA